MSRVNKALMRRSYLLEGIIYKYVTDVNDFVTQQNAEWEYECRDLDLNLMNLYWGRP